MVDAARTARETLAQFRGVGLVLAAAVLGVVAPAAGDPLAWTVTPLVILLVYGSLRNLRAAGVDRGMAAALGVGLVATLVVHPVVATGVGATVLGGPVLAGVVVVAAGPATAGSAVIWTRASGGSGGLAGLVAVASIALAPATTPALLSRLLSAAATVPVLAVARTLVVVVGGGLVLTAGLPRHLVDEAHISRASRVAILVLVYTSVATTGVGQATVGTLGGVAATAVAVCLLSLALALAGGRVLDVAPERTSAVFFGASLKNLGVALLVARSVDAAVVAVVAYYVTQQLFAGVVADLAVLQGR